MALHWLCFAHICEMLRLKDTSLQQFFSDGNRPGEHGLVHRQDMIVARVDDRIRTCGSYVPTMIAEGRISAFSYTVHGAQSLCRFSVQWADAKETRRVHVPVGQGDVDDMEDISWLLSL
jgi:hypothetical protein